LQPLFEVLAASAQRLGLLGGEIGEFGIAAVGE
jgi:hypothetical protein